MMQIKNMAAMVTGGGSGLGAATATQLATLGAKVAVVDIRQDAAESHAKTIGGIGIACDVADAASARPPLPPPAPPMVRSASWSTAPASAPPGASSAATAR